MAWPRRIYVATTSLGVYYTENFVDPGTQPVWTAINTGLHSTNLFEFWLDPFNKAERQYVMTFTGTILYRRENGGSWESILTPAQADTLTGQSGGTLKGFCVDPLVAGRLWVSYHKAISHFYALRSDDYGASWSSHFIYSGLYAQNLGSPRSIGDAVWVCDMTGISSQGNAVNFSNNVGASWGYADLGSLGTLHRLCINPLQSDRAYVSHETGPDNLARVATTGAVTLLQSDIPPNYDSMWFDPSDATHQRMINGLRLRVTNDTWATYGDAGVIGYEPLSISPWSGDDTDQMLVGLTLATSGIPPTQPHIIGALYGEADTTPDRIAGSSPGTAPYTDSIPYNCGGLARMGIQAVDSIGIVHTYSVAMPGYTGSDRGEPVPGDRASWEVGDTHSDDWDTGDSHHAAVTLAADADVLLGLTGQQIDLDPQAANTVFAGPASGADADPVFRALGTTDLPAHTHTESDISDLDHTDANAIHDADFSAAEGFMRKTGAGAYEAIKSNLGAAVAPTVDEDSGDGYAVGSIWIDTTADKQYICLDATVGAAVWTETTGAGGDDAADITYTPTTLTDWDSDTDPGDVDGALDQLAERINDVEGAAGHDAVTLGAGNDADMATLSTQELTVVLKDHDHSAAGDGNTFDAANLTAGASTDGQVLTSDGAGGAAWEDPPAGGAVDADDVTYTPTTATDWDADTDPGSAMDALDQLAERVDDLEAGAGGGAPTDAKYVTTAASAGLSAELVLPQLANYDPDTPPASAGAYDDEFDDDAVALAWSYTAADDTFDLDQAAGPPHISESLYHGFLLIQNDTITKAFTPDIAQAFTLVVKLNAGVNHAVNESYVSTYIYGQNSGYAVSVRCGRLTDGATSVRILGKNGGAEAEYGITYGGGRTGAYYIAISHNGSKSFNFWSSADGLVWTCVEKGRSMSNFTSFTELGIFVKGGAAGDSVDGIAAVDFVRYFESADVFKIGADA